MQNSIVIVWSCSARAPEVLVRIYAGENSHHFSDRQSGRYGGCFPCFHRIARSFPNWRRIVVTDVPVSQKVTSVEGILAKSGLIDGVIYFPPPPRKIRDFLRLWKEIRTIGPGALIYIADRDFTRTLRDICFFKLCGIGQVIGAPLSRDLRLPRVDPRTGYVEREAARLARCLAPLGAIDLNDPGLWDLCLQPDEIRIADSSLAPLGGKDFIAVNIGGKVRSKDWGDKNWIALFRLLAAEFSSLALTFVGSADEYDRSAELATAWRGPTLNLCGALETSRERCGPQTSFAFRRT